MSKESPNFIQRYFFLSGFIQFVATMIGSSYLKQTIVTVLCLLGIPSYLSAPKPISIFLEGQSSMTVPANRAVISLRIFAEGPKQGVVADTVRKVSDDLLATLRPLGQVSLPSGNSTSPQSTHEDLEPALVDLSVTTFRSYSWLKHGYSLLGREAPQYESSMEIEAEFRDFDALGLFLAQSSKQPAVTIHLLKWTLDEATRKRLFSQCRSDAMVDALDKVRAYIRPLGMDKVRAVKLTESQQRSRDVVFADVSGLRHHVHDELELLDDYDGNKPEAFGLEPSTLQIDAQINGEFCAWKTGLEAWFRRGGL